MRLDWRAAAMICAALRGERVPWPGDAGEGFPELFLAETRRHGVAGLLHLGQEAIAGWPEAVRAGILGRAAVADHWEERHRAALLPVVAGMRERGVEPIFLKGTALAYLDYPAPGLRERSDSDVLVPAEHRAAAHAALLAAGFAPVAETGREVFTQQQSYALTDAHGLVHAVDLHWQINNSPFLSRLFEPAAVEADSRPLPVLGPGARAAGMVDSLLLACLHREVHALYAEARLDGPAPAGGPPRREPEALIWLYDLHMLAGAMDGRDWSRVVEQARHRGLATICGHGLARARALLGSPCPEEVLIALADVPRTAPPAAWLAASALARHRADLGAVRGLGSKARWLREALLPSGAYMRQLYPGRERAWLPWLYVERAASRAVRRVAAALRH